MTDITGHYTPAKTNPTPALDPSQPFATEVHVVFAGAETFHEMEIPAKWGAAADTFHQIAFTEALKRHTSLWDKLYIAWVQQDAGDLLVTWDEPDAPTLLNKKPETAASKAHWVKDDKERTAFWQSANNLAKAAGFKTPPQQKAWIHEVLVGKPDGHIEDFAGTRAEAVEKLREAQKAKMAAEAAAKQAPATPPTEPTGDAPTASVDALKLEAAKLYRAADANVSDATLKEYFKADTGYGTAAEALDELGHGQTIDRVKAGIAKRADADPAPPRQPRVVRPRPAPTGITTITGIDVSDINSAMNEHYAAEAYSKIPYGAMEGKTDLGYEHARGRMDDVFGVHGFGWKLEPHPVLGKIVASLVRKTSSKGREYDEHNILMEAWVFKYRVRLPDGAFEWVELSPMSDSDANEEQGYAYRGAFTSLLKQVLRSLGGMDHILTGEYTHVQAAREKKAA